jgi:hypothetical protein
MQSISRRSFNIDVEGKIFNCKELSAGYIKAVQDGGDDTAALALKDSIGDISKEDYFLFGKDTEAQIYTAIVKFTFQDKITKDDKENIKNSFNLKDEEMAVLSLTAKEELKSLLTQRETTPKQQEESKKHSPS